MTAFPPPQDIVSQDSRLRPTANPWCLTPVHPPRTHRSRTSGIMEILTPAEQRTLEQRMQKRQVKEFMGAFGGLVEHCFMSCVDDFTSKALAARESGCVNRCVLKWMATQQRVSERFQEHNAKITQQMQNQK